MKDNVLKIEYVPIDDLKEYENNAKLHPQEQIEQIKKSINQFGMNDPIAVWKDNIIIEGHGRLIACKQLGFKELPIIRLDGLTDDERKAYTLVHNKLTMNTDFNIDILNEELANIEINLDDFGFDIELDDIDINAGDDVIEDDVPADVEPQAQYGDIYLLGEHRLMCGDSTNNDDVNTLLDDNKINCVFTDPPYGMNLDTDYTKMDNNSNIEFKQRKKIVGGKSYAQGIVDNFEPQMINEIININAQETFIWGANYFAELIPYKNDGSWFVWDKRDDNEQFDKMFGSQFELCWSKNKHKQEIARVRWCGVFGTETEFDKKRYHPTQKPIKLVTWFLNKFSKENENICDLFGGSGSTLIACEQLNRKCYMMELDPHYVDVIIARWENFTGKKAVKLNG